MDDVLDGLFYEQFYFLLFLSHFSVQFGVGHEMDEQVGDLVNEFEGFRVFEDYLSSVSFSVPVVFVVGLSLENLELWIFDVGA